jgi:serine/threonine protein kinase
MLLRATELESDPLVGAVIADRYLVERVIGSGGMGVVYQAEHLFMKRPCALKVLKPDLLNVAASVARFAREARNASRISHPNVATVYDSGEIDGGHMYMVMEYVDGQSLSTMLRGGAYFPCDRTAAIVHQIASALEAAHALGIIHRDLKPDNILLTRDEDGTDVVKVIDFGIARAFSELSQSITSTSNVVGTPAYMSPEQLSNDDLDARSDVYALGLTTYKMLTGSLPFGTSATDLPLRFLSTPRRLAELRPDARWSDELQMVLDKCLASNPEERYQSPLHFATDLIEVVASAALPRAATNWPTPAAQQHSSVPTSETSVSTGNIGTGRRRVIAAGVALAALTSGVFAISFSVGLDGASEPLTLGGILASAPESTPPKHASGDGGPALDPGTSQRGRIPPAATPENSDSTKVAGAPAESQSRGRGVRDKDPVVSRDSMTSAALQSVAAAGANDTGSAVAPPRPTNGTILLGAPGTLASVLFVGQELRGVLKSLSYISVPAGVVRIRLRLDGCQDFDSVVTVIGGDTAVIGNRSPKCKEDI